MQTLIELILRALAEAIKKGLDPVAHIRKRLDEHPDIDTEALDAFIKLAEKSSLLTKTTDHT